VKTATLMASTLQMLNDIEMVGNDLGTFPRQLRQGRPVAPVTAGSPTFKVREMTVEVGHEHGQQRPDALADRLVKLAS